MAAPRQAITGELRIIPPAEATKPKNAPANSKHSSGLRSVDFGSSFILGALRFIARYRGGGAAQVATNALG
jgi:hypothetical protein